MARIIAVVNQKGGVGKTTTTVNLTATLCAQGKRVLLCDFDPQANATSGLGVDKNGASPRYDYILIDCPPSLEMLTVNALCAAGSLLVPVQCEYYALEGLSDLLATVRLVKRKMNPGLALEGVLLTMFDSRTNLSLQVAAEVKRHFPGQVYATVIPRNVRLSEAPSHGKPVTAYDPFSRGAEAYTALAQEMIAIHDKN